MFETARLKLTAWYLLIIMLISCTFSVAFYHVATREIQFVIEKIKHQQERMEHDFPSRIRPQLLPPFSIEELEFVKDRIRNNLILLNGFILIVAGGAGYFLAGRTLRPIKVMVDEQNQFISSASHELRTPIATMRAEMESSLMEKNITDKEARALINSNLEELTTLQNLTNNLLRIAQIHSTGTVSKTEILSLQETVSVAIKKLTPLARQKEITISSEIGAYKIMGDKPSLTEVFVILIDNAIKYSPEKSQIRLQSKKEKGIISVFIRDEGIGITKKDLPRVFERFYRADKARNKDGYGLGLSIAKKIVETHNGTITVASKENKGTTFTVTFPVKTHTTS